MYTFVQGIRIELTPDQIKVIEKEKRRRERCRDSFVKTLKRFGFKKIDTSDWVNPNQDCYEHPHYEWFAEIYDRGGWNDVFMAGQGLKDGGFPGGWVYGDPEQIEKELARAIDELQNTKV